MAGCWEMLMETPRCPNCGKKSIKKTLTPAGEMWNCSFCHAFGWIGKKNYSLPKKPKRGRGLK